ncbi:MAG: WD40 repeat domain-containing serine/threonine protein kinase [Gemmataceae bacterium]
MKHSTPCPTSDRLGHLLAGDMAAPEEVAVAEHLSGCVVCQRRLEEQATGGEVDPGVLRELSHDDHPPNDSAYWQALSRIQHQTIPETMAFPDGDTERSSPTSFLQPPDRPGSIGKFAEFDIIRVIGRGGMGIVYEAIDPCLERRVALKVLDPQYAKDPLARQRFCREARAAAAVTHENVVIIHSVNEHSVSEVGDLPYLVMQYIPGETLQQWLDRGRPTIAEAVAIARQVSAGLAAAHRRGLIHRDVKPANILITQDESLPASSGDPSNVVAMGALHHVKLTDFGLARAAEDVTITQSGFVPGTPQYMAPEQARGEAIDTRSDLFSLGGVLYAMVTGQAPFQGSTPYLVLREVTDREPTPVQYFNANVPDWLNAIIQKLLAKKPGDRFQSAGEVAGLLFEGEARLLFCPVNGVRAQSALTRVVKSNVRTRLAVMFGFLVAGLIIGAVVAAAGFVPRIGRTPGPTGPAPVATLTSQFGAVASVDFNPDGKSIAMSAEDGSVRLWNRADGSIAGTFSAHKGPAWATSFAPNKSKLATVGEDGYVRVWTLPELQAAGEFPTFTSMRTVEFMPDSSMVVTGSHDGDVQLWDVTVNPLESKKTIKAHAGVVYAVAVTSDGATIASAGSDKMIKLWDAASGRQRLPLPEQAGPIYCLAFSPDNLMLASAGWDSTVRLWNVATGEAIGEFTGHTDDVQSIAFSPDGRHVVSGGLDKAVKVWEIGKPSAVATFHSPSFVHSVQFSPDGKQIAAGGRDGTVRIWSAPQ